MGVVLFTEQTTFIYCLLSTYYFIMQRESVKVSSAEKILAALGLLEVLVASDEYTTGVLSEIEPATITDVIEYQLQTNVIAFRWNTVGSGASTERDVPTHCR